MNLIPLGIFHTAMSLVAVAAAIVSLVRHHSIVPFTRSGRVYLTSLVITCLSGFFIFRHGTITPPHLLGVIVLGSLGIALAAGQTSWLGRRSAYVQTFALSFTVLLLSISTVTETLTRLPVSAPLVASPESPALQPIYGALLLAFGIGVTLQLRSQRRGQRYLAQPDTHFG